MKDVITLDNIPVLYEDDDYIILNKPANLLVLPDRFSSDKLNLYTMLKNKFSKIYIVHRIDKETSGVICFAKNKEAHRVMNRQFARGEVKKKYLALVKGRLTEASGRIELRISLSREKLGTVIIDKKRGKEAVTEYKVIEEFRRYTLVEVIPLTGRTHQIRIHFQAFGHPLAIDKFYNTVEAICLSSLKRNYKFKEDQDEKPLMSRLTLHAQEIIFYHFQKKNEVCITAPLPKDFTILLKQLRKNSK